MSPELDQLSAAIDAAQPDYRRDLERLVNIDCGSYTPAGVDEVGRFVAAFLADLGATVETLPDRDGRLGATVIGRFEGSRPTAATPGGPSSRLLLIGHMDTVFDPGTAAERPFAIHGDRATGPGTSDMKGGLLAGLYALRAIRDSGIALPFGQLVYVANPDEEIGSPSSTPHIRELAATADACLVLESARANGDVVSSRKGILDARLTVHGRAAHAGVEPEKGRSAILEAARLVRDLHALNGRWPGVTVNVGVISGGTRPNVVAERCTLEVDVRATTGDHLDAAIAAVKALAASPEIPDVTVDFEAMATWRPMEKLAGAARLVEHARAIAAELGFDLADSATGGASDANTTSGLGVPSLDGLGPIGGDDHSPSEWVSLESVPQRTALLAALILAIGRDPELRRRRSA